ncbi:hypothetical protein M9458_055845, partial [Cirrhinus mrigala]
MQWNASGHAVTRCTMDVFKNNPEIILRASFITGQSSTTINLHIAAPEIIN